MKYKDVFSDLCATLNEWNDAEFEPGERGRGNHLLCIILGEDGSGLFGTIDRAPKQMKEAPGYFEFAYVWDNVPMHLQGVYFSNLEDLETRILEQQNPYISEVEIPPQRLEKLYG